MSKYYKVKKVSDGIYILKNTFANMVLAVGRDRALLFDTGFGFADLKMAVEEITELPLYVVNSHGHFDHMGGNCYFKEPAYIHEKDLELARLHSSPEYRAYAYDDAKKVQQILFFLPCIPKTLSRKEYKDREPFGNYKTVKEGDMFDLGGMTFEVAELPGHTEGSIGLYCKERKLFLVSDAINDRVYLFLPESTHLDIYVQSLKHALGYDFDTFITGHAGKVYKRSEMERYLEVAENMDFENSRKRKGIEQLAPGVEVRECFKKESQKKKKEPFITISKDKL